MNRYVPLISMLLLTFRVIISRQLKSLDDGEMSYVDLDILQDKDIRTRNYSHASEDSGYFERCWNNPIRMYEIYLHSCT